MVGKSRKWSLVIALLLVVSMVAAACGGDDKDDNGDNGDNGGANNELNQTITGANGVTVKYPEGWVARDSDAGIEIMNSEEAKQTFEQRDSEDVTGPGEGQFGLFIQGGIPAADMSPAENPTARDAFETFVGFMAGENTEVGEITDIKIAGDRDAYKVTVSEEGTEGWMIGYDAGNATLIIAIGVAHPGEVSQHEETATAIIGSIEYTPPADAEPEATEAPAG